MASKITVNGLVTGDPGVYSSGDTRRVSGLALPINNIALVVELDFLENGKPVTVTTADRLVRLQPTNETLKRIANILYDPASDGRIPGGPNTVTLVSPAPTTQAQLMLLDAGGDDAILLLATAWGPAGNRTFVTVAANLVDATKFDIEISRDGVTERFLKIGSGPVITVDYDDTEADTVAVDVVREPAGSNGQLQVTYVKGGIALGTYNPVKLAFDGVVSGTPSVGAGGGESYTMTVAGINKATGAPDTEAVTWEAADATAQKSTAKAWSSVTSVTWATDGASVPTLSITGLAFDLHVDTYATAAHAADRINTFADQGFAATKASPKAASIPLDELDDATSADLIAGGQMTLRADVWAILKALVSSLFVTATRATAAGEGKAPPVAVGPSYLVGGSASTPVTADWGIALDALRSKEVQILWAGSKDAAVHSLADAHCIFMAGAGRNERNLWVGADAQETIDQLRTRTQTINSRFSSLVAQEARFTDHRGQLVWNDPMWLALMLAGMQAGSPANTSLTHKFPRVQDVRQNPAWDPEADKEELFDIGVTFLKEADGNRGLWVARDLTTYLGEEPFYDDRATVESINNSVRDMRDGVEFIVGDNAEASGVLSAARAVGRSQEGRLVRTFLESTLTARDEGSTIAIRYEFVPLETRNFVTIHASAVQAVTTLTTADLAA